MLVFLTLLLHSRLPRTTAADVLAEAHIVKALAVPSKAPLAAAEEISIRGSFALPSAASSSAYPPPTLPTIATNNAGDCVSGDEHTNWAGPITFQDCEYAIDLLYGRIHRYERNIFTFWSREFINVPPMDGWELPVGSAYGNCVLVVRIAKEFNNDVLPLTGGFLHPSVWSPIFAGTWQEIIEGLGALHWGCVRQRGLPGWAALKTGVLLFVPRDSIVRRQWTWPALMVANGTVDLSSGTLAA